MSDTGKVWVVDPTDGKPRQVDATEAQQGFTAGKLNLPTDGEIHMTAPDGTTMVGPTAKAQSMLEQGWRFAGKEDILRAKAQNQGGQAFLEGALSELTLGGSDVAAQQLFGVEGLRERRDTAAGTAGKVTGLAAGLFGPGLVDAAAGTAAKGVALQAAEAALTPIRAAQAAGDAVEALASKALGASLENQAAARAIAAGLGRGVEGAAYGAGGALSEEALGNPDANAQQLMAAMGGGALLGFGVGGALGAGFRAVGDGLAERAYKAGREAQAASVGARHMTSEQYQAALEAANGSAFSEEATKKGGLLDWLYGKYRTAASALGANPEDVDVVNSKFGQEVQREGRQRLEASGRRMGDLMDRMAQAQKDSNEVAYGALRKDAAAQLMPKGSAGEVVASAGRALDQARGVLDGIERDAQHMGLGDAGPALVKSYRQAIDEAEGRLMKEAGVPREYTEIRQTEVPNPNRRADYEPASVKVEEHIPRQNGLKDLGNGAYDIPDSFQQKVFEEVNHIKQLFQKPGKFGTEVSDAAQRDLKARFQDAYSGLRTHLEDESVWGKAGALQRDVNEAFAARAKSWDELQNNFGLVGDRFNRSNIASYVDKLDKLRGDRAMEALDAWQAANTKYADVLDKHFAGNAANGEAKALNKEFTDFRKQLEAEVQVFSASRRLIGGAQQRFGFGGNGGVVAGFVLGALGPLGALGAAAGESILNPGRAALLRANLAGVMRRVGSHISARVENLVTGGKALVPSMPTAQRMVARTTLDMLEASTPEERRKAYEKRVEELSRLSDPRTFGDHVANQTLGLSADVPKHADALSTTAATALAVLQNSFPATRPGTYGDGGPFDALFAKPVPHDRDIKKFAEVDHAVQAPVDALLGAAERGYVPEHVVRAVEAVYPQVTQAIRFGLVTSAGKLKGPLPHSRSRVLGSLLGGSTVPSVKLQRMQAVHVAQVAPSQPAPRVKTPRSTALQTSTDRLETYPYPP